MKTRQKEAGFQVPVAPLQLHPSLDAGAVGAILAFADCAPTACYEIYAAWKEGDAALAREKQERIAKAAERIVGGLSIPRREVRDGLQRALRRRARVVAAEHHRGQEGRGRCCWRTSETERGFEDGSGSDIGPSTRHCAPRSG